MNDENKKGGKRVGAGRKPLSVTEKKELVTMFVKGGRIVAFGGKDKMIREIQGFIENYGKPTIQDLNTPTNQIKPQEQPQTNYVAHVPQRKKTPQEWVEEKREIVDGDAESYQNWLQALNESGLPPKIIKEIKFA